jgi:hypothetical protein
VEAQAEAAPRRKETFSWGFLVEEKRRTLEG